MTLTYKEWQALANALDVALTRPDSGDVLTAAVERIVADREDVAERRGAERALKAAADESLDRRSTTKPGSSRDAVVAWLRRRAADNHVALS